MLKYLFDFFRSSKNCGVHRILWYTCSHCQQQCYHYLQCNRVSSARCYHSKGRLSTRHERPISECLKHVWKSVQISDCCAYWTGLLWLCGVLLQCYQPAGIIPESDVTSISLHSSMWACRYFLLLSRFTCFLYYLLYCSVEWLTVVICHVLQILLMSHWHQWTSQWMNQILSLSCVRHLVFQVLRSSGTTLALLVMLETVQQPCRHSQEYWASPVATAHTSLVSPSSRLISPLSVC